MKQALFNSNIAPTCAYCANGKPTEDGSCILCVKKGVMMPDSHCRKFLYDPLRRVPKKQPKLPSFSAEDFSIE